MKLEIGHKGRAVKPSYKADSGQRPWLQSLLTCLFSFLHYLSDWLGSQKSPLSSAKDEGCSTKQECEPAISHLQARPGSLEHLQRAVQALTLIQTIKFRSVRRIRFWVVTLTKYISGCPGRAMSGLGSYPLKPQAGAVRTVAVSTHLLTQPSANATGEMPLLRADRSTWWDARICPGCAVLATASSLRLCKINLHKDSLLSSGKVKVMLMTHDCIMEVSAWKDEIFVESLLHIVQKRNKDSVCVCIQPRGGVCKPFLSRSR